MRIAIDIDGTCANLVKGMATWLNEKYGDHPDWKPMTEEDIQVWNPYIIDPRTKKRSTFISEVIEAQSEYQFIMGLESYPHVVEVINSLLESSQYDIIFATKRGSSNGNCAMATVAWLHETFKINLKEMRYQTEVIFCHDIGGKQNVNADMLIDDLPRNLQAFFHAKPERYAVMIERPWNQDFLAHQEGTRFFNEYHTNYFKGWKEIGAFLNP